VPPRLCRSILAQLVEIGFVSELCSRLGRRSYQLGRAAENLPLAELLKTMRDKGEEALHLHPHPQTLVALEACAELERLVDDGLQGLTLKDLVQKCREMEEPGGGSPTGKE